VHRRNDARLPQKQAATCDAYRAANLLTMASRELLSGSEHSKARLVFVLAPECCDIVLEV